MMDKDFDVFLSQLSETNATLDYFADFEKVNRHVDKIKMKLNQLNYLIGQNDLRQAVYALYGENRRVFDVLDILVATRKKDKKKTIDRKGQVVLLSDYTQSPELVFEFIVDTGLAEVFKHKNITNLVDYVFGVEVGLDSNARKNRGGKQMERAVAQVFLNHGIRFEREVSTTCFPELSSLGDDVKRFDFVIRTQSKIYFVETNYYNSGGSKLNETARAYTDIAPKINRYEAYEFVWVTDGHGWLKAKNKLEEAYRNIPKVYNLTTLTDFIQILTET